MVSHPVLAAFSAALLLACAPAAQAYPARVVGELNLRAGPAPEFPVVRVLPSGMSLTVLGCAADYQWCDVDAEGQRDRVYAAYIEASYEQQRLPVQQAGPSLGLPVLSFVIGAYWGSHYRHQIWYGQRHRWTHWHYRPRPPVVVVVPPPRPPRPPHTQPPQRPQQPPVGGPGRPPQGGPHRPPQGAPSRPPQGGPSRPPMQRPAPPPRAPGGEPRPRDAA